MPSKRIFVGVGRTLVSISRLEALDDVLISF